MIDVQLRYAKDFEVCPITLDKLPGAWKSRIESVGMLGFNHFLGVDLSTGKMYPDIEAATLLFSIHEKAPLPQIKGRRAHG